MSADGHVLAVATLSGHVEVWDVERGVLLTAFDDGDQIRRVVIAADGKTLVTCGINPVIRSRLSRPRDGSSTSSRLTRPGYTCATSPDSARLLLLSIDGTVDEWDLRTGDKLASITSAPYQAAYSPDGRMIVTGHLSGAVILWAADTGVEVARYQGSAVWPRVAFSADGTLVLATDATQITGWSTRGRRRMSFVPNPDELIAATNLDATRVITRRANGQLFVRDALTGAQLGGEPLHTHGGIDDDAISALSSDGRRFAAAAAAGKVAVIDLKDGSTIASIDVGHDPTGLWLDRTGDRLLVVGDGAPRVWDVDHVRLVSTLDHHAHATALDPSGRLAMVWTDPRTVDIWDIDANRARSSLHLDGEFTAIGFDATGTRILLSEQLGLSAIGLSELFDVRNGNRLFAVSGSANFNPTRTLITTYGSGRFEVWRAADVTQLSAGQLRAVGTGDPGADLAVSDDGRFVIMMNNDSRTLSVHDAADGRLLDRLDGSSGHAYLSRGHGISTGATVPPVWISGTHSVIATAGRTSVWDLELEERTPAEVHRIVSAHARWHVVDGRLVAVLGRIEGRVSRDSAAIRATRVFAKRANAGARLGMPYEATVGVDGTFAIDELPFGAYSVSAGSGASVTANVTSAEPVHIEIAQ